MNRASRFVIYSSPDTMLGWDADCNCACPSTQPVLSAAALSFSSALRSHPHQQYIDLVPGYRVVFVPSISKVAVLNDEAFQLLRQFEEPHTLEDLCEEERIAARELALLGLLHPHNCQLEAHSQPDELIAWLHVTNACNLRCTYCYIDKDDEAMTTETALTAVDTILRSAQLHGYQRVMIKYAGGEASLNLPLVVKMHRYAQSQTASSQITIHGVVLSNGVGWTRYKLQQIRDLGLRLMISLDGPQAFHDFQRPKLGGQGSFDAAIRSINFARDLGIDLTISVTVTGASVSGLPGLVAWLLDHELHFSLNFYRECHTSAKYTELKLEEQELIDGMRAAYRVIEQNLPRYNLLGCLIDRANLSVAHQRTCAVGDNYLVVDHQGGIAKCQMEIQHPVTTIWADDPLTTIRVSPTGVINLLADQKEGCRHCEWKYWCAGGCAVATFRATGRYDVRSPNCGIYKALYPDVIRLEGLRLLKWAD